MLISKGLLKEEMKPKLAKAITDAHVEATGAPPVCVHVYFNELPLGSPTAPVNPTPSYPGFKGRFRAGRTLDQNRL
jgi:hypothetical protein